MKNALLGHILRLGPPLRDLCASAAGCFVMMRGFRLVAAREEESRDASPIGSAGTSHIQWPGIGAALFLLIFIASETMLAIHAFRH